MLNYQSTFQTHNLEREKFYSMVICITFFLHPTDGIVNKINRRRNWIKKNYENKSSPPFLPDFPTSTLVPSSYPEYYCTLFLTVNKLLNDAIWPQSTAKNFRILMQPTFSSFLTTISQSHNFLLIFFQFLFFSLLFLFILFFFAVPVYEVSGISGESVRLPCNISIAEGQHHEEDNVVLVLWYREDLGTLPIYR